MIGKRNLAIGSVLALALIAAPISSAFAGGGNHGGYGHGGGHGGHGYGYGYNPVVGLATAWSALPRRSSPRRSPSSLRQPMLPTTRRARTIPAAPQPTATRPAAQGYYGAPVAPIVVRPAGQFRLLRPAGRQSRLLRPTGRDVLQPTCGDVLHPAGRELLRTAAGPWLLRISRSRRITALRVAAITDLPVAAMRLHRLRRVTCSGHRSTTARLRPAIKARLVFARTTARPLVRALAAHSSPITRHAWPIGDRPVAATTTPTAIRTSAAVRRRGVTTARANSGAG